MQAAEVQLRAADADGPPLACPVCKAALTRAGETFLCQGCGETFPVVRGVPVLINDARSVFRRADFTAAGASAAAGCPPQRRGLARRLAGWRPSRSVSSTDFDAADALGAILAERPRPRVLVIGCGEDASFAAAGASLVYTDVQISPLVQYLCDAHDLPFADACFDAVFAIAVLEHVIDPRRCVAEIERVLALEGWVYAVTPFMQQVHLGRHDFTRFSFLGQRALFAGFRELRSGIANGPGMAAAWAVEYMATSFFLGARARSIAAYGSRLALGWLGRLDRRLNRKAGAFDGASAFYFFGRKSDRRLSPREILDFHRGLNPR